MKPSKRIDVSLFEQPLIDLINASSKIFPASYTFVVGNTNPNNYEYVKVTEVGPHKNEIYTWDINQWVLVGADDLNVVWEEIKNRPVSFNPIAHVHTKSDITDFAHNHDTLYSALTHNHDASYSALTHNHNAQYSPLAHNHDSSYAPISHDHDGRYNTKSEVTTLLGGKSDISHTHADLHTHTNKTTIDKLTQTHIDALNNGLSNGHTHGNLPLLDKITYTGTQPTIDLIQFEQGFSGSYVDLTNKPVIPSTTSQLTNNSGFITDVSGKADTTYVNTELAKKADGTTLSGHTDNSTVHVTQTDKNTWNSKLPSTIPAGQGMIFDTEGLANGRLFTLNGVPNWVGWTLNAGYSAQGWNLDDTTTPGWFLKLDVRTGFVEFALYKIPAGANPHTNEYPVFRVSGADDEAYIKTNKVIHAGNIGSYASKEITIDTVQPTTDLWYKVVG